MENTKEKSLALEMSNFCNSYSPKNSEFISEMSTEHRTIQQAFTKLCLKWIESVASDEYRYDLRNEDSHEICKEMVQAFKQAKQDGFSPSEYLRMI
jgi:hypothetical protein